MVLSIIEFIGRFHPLLVHLPIGILLLALLLQWLFRKEQYTLTHGIMKVIWLLGMATALLSSITGYLLSLSGEYEGDTVALHMWMGIGVVVISILICAKVLNRQFDAVYKVASVALLLLILLTGHFGGSLTHGSDYLTSAISETTERMAVSIKPVANIEEANAYADIVQPVLQSKCFSCHGTQKQKGRLRMDSPEYLLKGGKNGKTIIPGTASESELIKRLLLPKHDKKHMPPKEKPQLNEEQIALLYWWVDQGAPFHKQVKELQLPEKVKAYLYGLQKSNATAERSIMNTVPEAPVEKADAKALEAVRSRGVMVLPVAQNSNYLMANFLNVTELTNKDIALLLPLKKQLVWLKLGSTTIGDSALAVISQCQNLTILQLNGTYITDRELGRLSRLKHLQSLNLVATKVSAEGIKKIKDLQQLQSLYLYQTNVTKNGGEQLQKIFPKTKIEMGGYVVPGLPTDTIQAVYKKS